MIQYDDDDGYRNAILRYFSLSEYNEESIMKKTAELFLKIKEVPEFQEKMRDAAASMGCEDLELGLIVLFSYDHFPELVSLLENHQIKLSE